MLRTGAIVDGHYRLEAMLGRGGMADVFRAVDARTDQAVALKALRVGEPRYVERFRSEIAVLERLDHPAVVSLRDAGTHDQLPYLVMDLVDGPALDEVLEDGPLGLERSIAVGREVAVALAEAHRLGIVHRDVKPANVLLDGHGTARLSDFGIARMAGTAKLTAAGTLVGSPAYVAPEQVGGRAVGPATDVYALGLVVIECLTGSACYTGSPSEAALARLRRPPAIPDDLPVWLRGVLRAMTAREPDRRPGARAVADAFEHRSADGVLALTAPLRIRTATQTRPRPRTRATLGRAEVAVAALAAIVLLTGLAAGSVLGMRDITVTEAPPSTSTTVAPPPTTAPAVVAPVEAPANPGDDHDRGSDEGSGDGGDRGNGKGNGKGRGKGRGGG